MPDYTTSHCPICEQRFSAQDDIVVCPVCGTPYHRSCYRKAGQCINTELHQSGESWSPEQAAGEQAQKLDGSLPRRCSRCGTINPPETVYCQICGNKLEENPQNAPAYHMPGYNGPTPISPSPFTTPFGGVPADDTIEGVSVRDLTLFVGESSYYFIPRFKALAQGNARMLWNWPALLFHFLYCFYRKMYRVGFLLLAVLTLLNLPNMVLGYEYALQLLDCLESGRMFTFQSAGLESLVALSYIGQFLSFGVRIFFAVRFNQYYCRHALARVREIQSRFESHDSPEYVMALSKKGRTNFKLIIVLVLLVNLFYIGSYLLLSSLL